MKRTVILWGLLGLVGGCESHSLTAGSLSGACPPTPAAPPKLNIARENLYEAFNYQIQEITGDRATVNFQSSHYDFIFCRQDRRWLVRPRPEPSPPPPTYETRLDELANPPWQTLTVGDRTFQYRVLLVPNPFPNFAVEPQEVIFELLVPDRPSPQRQVLYTRAQVQQSQTGFQLGIPEIVAARHFGDRLFWAVSPEQGEGNGGIATLIRYDLRSQTLSLLQPQSLIGEQINDVALAGDPENPTVWLATQRTGEGNPYLPSLGLVRLETQPVQVHSYRVDNSPLIGAIPTRLHLDGDTLWVGTGNGICQLPWQTPDAGDRWHCWRFTVMAELPPEGLPIYESLQTTTPAAILRLEGATAVEVLFPAIRDGQAGTIRYEIRYEPGFTVTLAEGAQTWSAAYGEDYNPRPWQPPLFWPGVEWHWGGDRFVRGLDEVQLNLVGGGPSGIELPQLNPDRPNLLVLRGDLRLLSLNSANTQLTYHSAWVETDGQPYLTLIAAPTFVKHFPNPLLKIAP